MVHLQEITTLLQENLQITPFGAFTGNYCIFMYLMDIFLNGVAFHFEDP